MDGGRVLRALLATPAGTGPRHPHRRHARSGARGGRRAGGAAVQERQPGPAADRALRLPGRRQRGRARWRRGWRAAGSHVADMMVTGVPHHPGPCHARRRRWSCSWPASSGSFPWSTTWAGPRAPHARQPDPRPEPARRRRHRGRGDDAGRPRRAAHARFQEALDRLRASGLPALPVVDGDGALVGPLTMDNITDLLLVRRARRRPGHRSASRLLRRSTSGSAWRGSTTTRVTCVARRGPGRRSADPGSTSRPAAAPARVVPSSKVSSISSGSVIVPRLERKTFCRLSAMPTESTA